MVKTKVIQKIAPRRPQQERAQQKVELILEAAIRLLGKRGIAALTTNAVAETAGVSIGTLYQYFPNKDAILDALADREVAAMGTRVRQVVIDAAIASPEARVVAIVGAVAASYGERREAHRLIMAHSLARGGNRVAGLLSELIAYLQSDRPSGGSRGPFEKADAFVLIHAFAGVLRAMTSQADAPPRADIEKALVRLISHFA